MFLELWLTRIFYYRHQRYSQFVIFYFVCRFWNETSAFTPESRVKAHQKIQEVKDRDKKKE